MPIQSPGLIKPTNVVMFGERYEPKHTSSNESTWWTKASPKFLLYSMIYCISEQFCLSVVWQQRVAACHAVTGSTLSSNMGVWQLSLQQRNGTDWEEEHSTVFLTWLWWIVLNYTEKILSMALQYQVKWPKLRNISWNQWRTLFELKREKKNSDFGMKCCLFTSHMLAILSWHINKYMLC